MFVFVRKYLCSELVQCWCIALILELVQNFWLFCPRKKKKKSWHFNFFGFFALNKGTIWLPPTFPHKQGTVAERIILEKLTQLYFEVFSWREATEFLSYWAILLYCGVTFNFVYLFYGKNRLDKLVSVFTGRLSSQARNAWDSTVVYLGMLSSVSFCYLKINTSQLSSAIFHFCRVFWCLLIMLCPESKHYTQLILAFIKEKSESVCKY